MIINKSLNGNELVLEVEGRLDTTTAPELENVLTFSLEDVTSLVFDFNKLDYISSAGLRVLLSAQKTMRTKGDMKVIGVNEVINEIFEVTGFNDILDVELAGDAEA